MNKEVTIDIENPKDNDLISRQAVLDKMKERDEELSSICPKDIRDLPPVKPQEPNRDIEEIEEIINCDADAETKCKMISNILNAKPHYFKEQEPKAEKVIKMRDATPEENEAIDKYIKSISKPTGVNIFDFYEDDEQEQINFVQPKKSMPCTIKIQADEKYTACDTCYYKVNDNQTMADECYDCDENPYKLKQSWGQKCSTCKHHTDADEIHGYTPCGNCGIEQSNYEPKDKPQADGEKTCGTCRNNDTYHCAECENKSDYEQAQADGEYKSNKELLCDSCYRKIAGCQAKFHNPHPVDHCIEYKPIETQADGEYISRQAVLDIRCGDNEDNEAEPFKGMTNGEVIKAIFPNAEFENAMPFTDGRWETMNLDTENKTRATYKPTQLRTYADWWNAPYERS